VRIISNDFHFFHVLHQNVEMMLMLFIQFNKHLFTLTVGWTDMSRESSYVWLKEVELLPANPSTRQPANPPTCQLTNPPTCQPANPPSRQPAYPPSRQPAYPPSRQPAYPPSRQPAN